VLVISRPKEIFRLRQQTVSSSAFSFAEMQSLSVHDIRDISMFVPSFSMPNYGSRLTSSMYIRGIGSRLNNPAVAMYFDDMPILSKSAFNIHTYDISLFEVLCGPQGTLYGQNSEGGLVRLYSIDPFDYQVQIFVLVEVLMVIVIWNYHTMVKLKISLHTHCLAFIMAKMDFSAIQHLALILINMMKQVAELDYHLGHRIVAI
jgi:hypothetical protein